MMYHITKIVYLQIKVLSYIIVMTTARIYCECYKSLESKVRLWRIEPTCCSLSYKVLHSRDDDC